MNTLKEVPAPFCLNLDYDQAHRLIKAVRRANEGDLITMCQEQYPLWQARVRQRGQTLYRQGNLPARELIDDKLELLNDDK